MKCLQTRVHFPGYLCNRLNQPFSHRFLPIFWYSLSQFSSADAPVDYCLAAAFSISLTEIRIEFEQSKWEQFCLWEVINVGQRIKNRYLRSVVCISNKNTRRYSLSDGVQVETERTLASKCIYEVIRSCLNALKSNAFLPLESNENCELELSSGRWSVHTIEQNKLIRFPTLI